jgi:hypothetical protein
MDINIENSRRRDPSTQLVHVGCVIDFGDLNESNCCWIPFCKLKPRTDTAFWATGIAPDTPTSCLICMLQE